MHFNLRRKYQNVGIFVSDFNGVLSKELKIVIGQAIFKVMDENSQNVVWINNSRIVWPTLALMLFLSSLDNLVKDSHVFFSPITEVVKVRISDTDSDSDYGCVGQQ